MVRGPRGREKGVFFEQVRRGGLSDPYIPKKGWEEPTVCPQCRAIYYKKRWTLDERVLDKLKGKEIKYHKCPACQKIEDRYAMGIIDLTGGFVTEHREELINLIHSEERRAREKNPLERIIIIEKKDGGIHTEVTTDSLALRIGRVLCRAYKGEADYKFRYGDKYVTVQWHREM